MPRRWLGWLTSLCTSHAFSELPSTPFSRLQGVGFHRLHHSQYPKSSILSFDLAIEAVEENWCAGETERKEEREEEGERKRETEFNIFSFLSCSSFYGDWFPLPRAWNSHNCHSHQALDSLHSPISHCSFGQTGSKGVQHLLVLGCFTILCSILSSYLCLTGNRS